jgi:hypothetical protein
MSDDDATFEAYQDVERARDARRAAEEGDASDSETQDTDTDTDTESESESEGEGEQQ